MNTPANIRIASAFASVVITFSLLSAVATMAQPQGHGAVLLAQATTATVR